MPAETYNESGAISPQHSPDVGRDSADARYQADQTQEQSQRSARHGKVGAGVTKAQRLDDPTHGWKANRIRGGIVSYKYNIIRL